MQNALMSCTIPVTEVRSIKQKVLNWLRLFDTFCFLDNQEHNSSLHEFECLAAAGVREKISGDDVKTLNAFFEKKEWLFGHLSYELRNSLHSLSASTKKDEIGFPLFYFFIPEVVIVLKEKILTVHAENPDAICAQILAQPETNEVMHSPPVNAKFVLSKEEYTQKLKALQAHILRGDCYEINFCQEAFAEGVEIDSYVVFQNLMQVSPNPFSALYRLEDKFLLCASPERFLAKRGNRLISQPIKGTARRDLYSKERDDALRESLQQSPKDRAENVMVVDLVRNDLTKICKPASVKVDELFGVYSFPQVHQMISTISGELSESMSLSQILEATFPMGSMTGAPKLSVMKLIDEYEPSARGIFSGSVGYKAPSGDFDLAVVIRSIMYNQTRQRLSYQVGSGITFYSDAEKEWEECMLKATAIRKVLS